MVTSDFINSFVQLENRFGKSDDVVGEFCLTDAVLVAEAAALARAPAVCRLVVSDVTGCNLHPTLVERLRIAHRCITCVVIPHNASSLRDVQNWNNKLR